MIRRCGPQQYSSSQRTRVLSLTSTKTWSNTYSALNAKGGGEKRTTVHMSGCSRARGLGAAPPTWCSGAAARPQPSSGISRSSTGSGVKSYPVMYASCPYCVYMHRFLIMQYYMCTVSLVTDHVVAILLAAPPTQRYLTEVVAEGMSGKLRNGFLRGWGLGGPDACCSCSCWRSVAPICSCSKPRITVKKLESLIFGRNTRRNKNTLHISQPYYNPTPPNPK